MAANATRAILREGKTALFVCDMQDKFAKVIFEFDKIVTNSAKLVRIKYNKLSKYDHIFVSFSIYNSFHSNITRGLRLGSNTSNNPTANAHARSTVIATFNSWDLKISIKNSFRILCANF